MPPGIPKMLRTIFSGIHPDTIRRAASIDVGRKRNPYRGSDGSDVMDVAHGRSVVRSLLHFRERRRWSPGEPKLRAALPEPVQEMKKFNVAGIAIGKGIQRAIEEEPINMMADVFFHRRQRFFGNIFAEIHSDVDVPDRPLLADVGTGIGRRHVVGGRPRAGGQEEYREECAIHLGIGDIQGTSRLFLRRPAFE